jgi:alkanesulfonate monooxygenase SsuD/methylene tetrahydromethanopterin reductase-like flavin-dependent oxidoreductase (luciferase family)
VNVVVAPTQEEAQRQVQPNLHSMVALRTGGRLHPQKLVEEAEKDGVPEQHQGLAAAMATRWVVGDPASAAEQVRQLATTYDVDEVMLHPVAGAYVGTDPATAPNREETLRLLAGALEH